MQGLRTELDKITPRPLLTAAVWPAGNPPAIVAAAMQYTDIINIMSYGDIAQAQQYYDAYISAGIPANK